MATDEPLYEKCADCHLFVEPNDNECRHCGLEIVFGNPYPDAHDGGYPEGVWFHPDHGGGGCGSLSESTSAEPSFAPYLHLHRGDEADEKLDESHEPKPSGMKANLAAWEAYGPPKMRERFVR